MTPLGPPYSTPDAAPQPAETDTPRRIHGLEDERDTVIRELEALRAIRDALRVRNETLIPERDALQRSLITAADLIETLTRERDALRAVVERFVDGWSLDTYDQSTWIKGSRVLTFMAAERSALAAARAALRDTP